MVSVSPRHFLDVRQSASGLAWVHRLSPQQENIALAIAQDHGISDLVARVLAGRGVTPALAAGFLDPTIKDLLPDPVSLTDMDRAAHRIARAVTARESVAIFGDYDVDGASSSAMLARFLGHFGVQAEIYIPDRIFEGYGPNPDAMRDLVLRGASLIVTVDCGTNSGPSIDAANEAGADVVVLDHHQVGGPLPSAVAVVNPNRDDDLSGQGHLCAAGVTFLTLVQVSRVLREQGMRDLPDLLSLLDLAALGTVCDVVPLTGVNRAFVVKGLLAMRRMENAGIAALARTARIGEPLNSFHLGFLIGPRINAGGRIGDAALGARLLTSDDPVETRTIAEKLEVLNQERQAMEQVMLAKARDEADAELANGAGPAVLVTASDDWHPGIVGLIASRLKDHARRPAFAIAFNPSGMGTGSGRSIPGFDLGHLVREAHARGLIVKGGGHAMAAGITVQREKLGALRSFFEEAASDTVFSLRDSEMLKVDGALSADGANLALFDMLERAGPFGAGHSAPMLVLPRHRIADARTVGTGHIRLQLRSEMGGTVTGIAFRAAETELGRFLFERRGRSVHVAGVLSANHWNGSRSVQMRVIDAAAAD